MKCYDCEGTCVEWCCGIDYGCETCAETGELPVTCDVCGEESNEAALLDGKKVCRHCRSSVTITEV